MPSGPVKATDAEVVLALHRCKGVVARAAESLGVSRQSLTVRVAASETLQAELEKARAVDGKAVALVAEEAKITAAKVLGDLEEARVRALEDGKYQAAIKASELQGKHLGMFKEQVEHTGANGGPILAAIEVRFVNAGD